MNDSSAERDIQRFQTAKAERGTWDTTWQQIADYVMPRKSQINTTKTPAVEGYTDNLFNTEAIRANQVLAAGQKDYLFSGRWFSFEAPDRLAEDDAVKRYFSKCTEIALKALAKSNFMLCVHEMLLDRGAFGIGTLYSEIDQKGNLRFHTDDVGTFCVYEGEDGLVDTVIREFELTPRQAATKFGVENLGPKLLKALNDEKCRTKPFKFIHTVEPRYEYNEGRKDPESKPIASRYVCVEDKKMVQEGGYEEMPYCVSRYLKWGKSPYGYSPSIEALPTIRQVNFIEKSMDALAEIKAFPRVLVPAGMDGVIDLMAGGVTTFDPNNPNAMPREWGYNGEYNIGLERIEKKNDAIKKAYHVDLFMMLQSIERQMTAYEVSQRMAEKVAAFSPTFYRMQVELFTPLMNRVFSLLFRNEDFPEPPESLFVAVGNGAYSAALPEISLNGKLAMYIKEMENQGFLKTIEILAPIAQLRPDIMDNYNLDIITRGIGRNNGVPVAWENSEEDRDDIRAQREQAMQQQQALANAQALGGVAKDLSSSK
jgi:hypothetical protein